MEAKIYVICSKKLIIIHSDPTAKCPSKSDFIQNSAIYTIKEWKIPTRQVDR